VTSRSADHPDPAPRELQVGAAPGDDVPASRDAADPGAATAEVARPGPAGGGAGEPGPAADDGGRPAPVPAPRPPLDDLSQRILAFERQWWRRPGAKERAIRERFGLSVTRYYQLLNSLLDDPGALAYDPVLVLRLRRLRQRRSGGASRGGLR